MPQSWSCRSSPENDAGAVHSWENRYAGTQREIGSHTRKDLAALENAPVVAR